jgi:hypothetical protein
MRLLKLIKLKKELITDILMLVLLVLAAGILVIVL